MRISTSTPGMIRPVPGDPKVAKRSRCGRFSPLCVQHFLCVEWLIDE